MTPQSGFAVTTAFAGSTTGWVDEALENNTYAFYIFPYEQPPSSKLFFCSRSCFSVRIPAKERHNFCGWCWRRAEPSNRVRKERESTTCFVSRQSLPAAVLDSRSLECIYKNRAGITVNGTFSHPSVVAWSKAFPAVPCRDPRCLCESSMYGFCPRISRTLPAQAFGPTWVELS